MTFADICKKLNPLTNKVLIIDDEVNLRGLLARIIQLEGYTVAEADSGKSAWKFLEQETFQVIITDVKLPDVNGVDLTAKIKSSFPSTEIIVLTAYGTIQDGVKAIKNGAFDYLTKGDHQSKIIPLLSKATEKALLQQKVSDLEKRLSKKFGFDKITGTSRTLLHAIDMAKKVAATDTTALILGETGVGKEVFAEAIHYESHRKSKPLVALNCSAFAKDLLESELFGHAEGAFTGATKAKKGLLEEAHEGTLFLDEIGEMNIDLQAKFLRVLETGEFYRVGDSKPRKVNIRLIAATNRDLEQEIKNGKFREDLFYRLSVFTINIPPLRERLEDIEPLANHFVEAFSEKTNKKILKVETSFLKILKSHPWKGNIRELKNVIERCVILVDGDTLIPELLPFDFNAESSLNNFDLASVEKNHIQKVLRHTQGNKTETARLLNIGLTTLYRKIQDYGINT
ncbi:sigma-54-dependent Fis family transcriptional regulator [Cytophagales bacterium WSM2-2]|nr:sigma-54-dependent Fis family transcriptional regulator [Cytophagales bacterium WSM2-2]